VSSWDGPAQLVAGLFYQDLDQKGGFPVDSRVPVGSQLINLFGSGVVVGDSFFSLDSSTEQQETGVFGELEYALAPELKVTVGGRYFNVETTQSRKDGGILFSKFGAIIAGRNIDPPRTTATQTENGFNPRFAVTWEPSQDVTLYANAARGFRPGRVNATANACAALGVTVPANVASDSLWNYEGGGKFRLFDGRASLNMAGYYIVWKDRQTQTFNCGGLGFGAQENVGEAESKGGEMELSAELFEGLNLSAGVGYTFAVVTDRGKVTTLRNGQRLANVPLWNGAIALDYDQPITEGLGWFGGLDLRYVGGSISAQNNRRPEYWLANARVGIKSGEWRFGLFGQNLGNERANLADPPELSDALNLIAVSRPRTIGVDLRRSF
jgi:iron complex outermembrane recepter protein